LAGSAPGEWAPPDFVLDTLTLPTDLPLTVASELVHDRPDILPAEAQPQAASAAIGVATAQLYPSITLSASVALETVATSGVFLRPIHASRLSSRSEH